MPSHMVEYVTIHRKKNALQRTQLGSIPIRIIYST